MAANLVLKQDDTYPPLQATLSENGSAIDLTTATSVEVVLKGQASSTVITGACTYPSPTTGGVSYAWQIGDTATPDTYAVEWMITWTGGKEQTVPNSSTANPTVEIDSRLDGATG